MSIYYSDDQVTLYRGDCLAELAWNQADVLLTDPPYGISARLDRGRGTKRGGSSPWVYGTIMGDESTVTRDAVLTEWGDKPALIFGSWKAPKPSGTRALLIWDKGSAAGMGDLSIPWKPNTEEIYVLGKGFSGPRTTSVLSAHMTSWATKGRVHPNQKPEALIEELLIKCPPGIIADPFAGSGSTLVAAKKQGRKAIGVEVEERYCETIAKRLSQEVLDLGVAS